MGATAFNYFTAFICVIRWCMWTTPPGLLMQYCWLGRCTQLTLHVLSEMRLKHWRRSLKIKPQIFLIVRQSSRIKLQKSWKLLNYGNYIRTSEICPYMVHPAALKVFLLLIFYVRFHKSGSHHVNVKHIVYYERDASKWYKLQKMPPWKTILETSSNSKSYYLFEF